MPETMPPAGMVNNLLSRRLKNPPAIAIAKVSVQHRVARYISRIHRCLLQQSSRSQGPVEQVQVANRAVDTFIANRAVQKILGYRISPLPPVVPHNIHRNLIINCF